MYVGSRNILPTYLAIYIPISCHHVQPWVETELLEILSNMATRGCEAPCPSHDVMDEMLCYIQHKHEVAENTN